MASKTLEPDDPRHGTTSGYRYGCRCDPCKEAKRTCQSEYRTSLESLAPDDPRHGTLNGYVNRKCRCDPCKEANTQYYFKKRKKMFDPIKGTPVIPVKKLDPDDPRHGTPDGYDHYLCRCYLCREAKKIEDQRDLPRKKS